MSENRKCLLAGISETKDSIRLYQTLTEHNIMIAPKKLGRCVCECGRCGLVLTAVFPIGEIVSPPEAVGLKMENPESICTDAESDRRIAETLKKYPKTELLRATK